MEYPKYKREEKLSAKLSYNDIAEIKKLRAKGLTFKKISSSYSVDAATIRTVCLTDKERKEHYKKMYIRQKGIYHKDMKIALKKAKERKIAIFGKATLHQWFNEYVKKNNKTYKESQMKWRENNPNYLKTYRIINKEILSEKKKKYYIQNRDEILLRRKKYYLKNKLNLCG